MGVCDDAVEGGDPVAFKERRASQGVVRDDLEFLDAVKQQVHARDAGGGENLLLAEWLPPQPLRTSARGLDVLDGLDEHAPGPASRVVDRLAFLGVEDVDHQSHDRTGRVVLACLLVRLVREPLDQVLVCLTEHVWRDGGVRQRLGGEVLDEVGHRAVGQLGLVRPRRTAEDPVQRVGVGLLDLAHRSDQGLATLSARARTSDHLHPSGIWNRWFSANAANSWSPPESAKASPYSSR